MALLSVNLFKVYKRELKKGGRETERERERERET